MKVSDIVEKYVDLRSKLDAKRKEYKKLEKEVKDELNELELQLLEEAEKSGLQSFSTSTHTAYSVTKKYASMENRELAIKYVQDTGDFGIFTNHVSKVHVLELLEEGINPEALGITYVEERAFNVKSKPS